MENIEKKEPKKVKKQKKELTPEEKQKLVKKIKRLSLNIGITSFVLVSICLIFYFFIGWFYRVDSNDMFPNIQDGDLLVYTKLSDFYAKDIVVYEVAGETRVGRVFGVAGDSVTIREDGYLMLNNSLPYEVNIFYPTTLSNSSLTFPLTVSEGNVFILGDCRTSAKDSRHFGEIPLSSVKGKVVLLLLRQRSLFN